MYAEVFPSRLKALRKENNITQTQAANDIGIGQVTLSQYENGTREPDIETLARIAKYYNITIDWLCGASSNKKENLSKENKEAERNKIIIEKIKDSINLFS